MISPRSRILWGEKLRHHTAGIWQKLNLKLETGALTTALCFLMLEDVWYHMRSVVTHGIFLSRLNNVFFSIILFASSHPPIATHSCLQTLLSNYREKPLRIIDLIIQCIFLQAYSVCRSTAYVFLLLPVVYKALPICIASFGTIFHSLKSPCLPISLLFLGQHLHLDAFLTSGSSIPFHSSHLLLNIEPLVNFLDDITFENFQICISTSKWDLTVDTPYSILKWLLQLFNVDCFSF